MSAAMDRHERVGVGGRGGVHPLAGLKEGWEGEEEEEEEGGFEGEEQWSEGEEEGLDEEEEGLEGEKEVESVMSRPLEVASFQVLLRTM